MSSPTALEALPSPLLEEERRELEAVIAAMAGSSRLVSFLNFIGEKYFSGQADDLNEYKIATEVFGRSRTTFNAAEDAIVRVEAHRLRKRLKEFYEREGKSHSIHLSVPPGGYVPVFSRTETVEAPILPPQPPASPAFPSHAGSRRWWPYALAAILGLVALPWSLHTWRLRRDRIVPAVKPDPPSPAAATAGTDVPLRIMSGYYGKPQIDNSGDTWLADRYFHSGGSWAYTPATIQRTTNPTLYSHWRSGDFSYDIPLRPGSYELHLYFASTEPDLSSPATFTVTANGQPLLSAFDVNSDAMGAYVADERVFRDLSPGADGMLHIVFAIERGAPVLNALAILPGTQHRTLPLRIITQSRPFTDNNGQLWRPDDYFMGGYNSVQQQRIAGTSTLGLFASERYGHFTYSLPADTRDRYTVVLHFAEFYFGPTASNIGGVGSRIFRVECNGATILDNFDIFKEAGSLHALTKTFNHIKPTAQGKINLDFEPIVNNATISGIELIDEGPA